MFNRFLPRVSNRYQQLLLATKQMPANAEHEVQSVDKIFINGTNRSSTIVSARAIRLSLNPRQEVITTKINLSQEYVEAITNRVKSIKSINLKCLLLRQINGDIFTKEKLFRLGLTDDDRCAKCRETETITHLLYECWYSARLWNSTYRNALTTLTGLKHRILSRIGNFEAWAQSTSRTNKTPSPKGQTKNAAELPD